MNNLDWLKTFNHSLDYIEENLDKEIIVKKASEIACCSEYHYQRMFSFIANISLGEYIRRRRLTLAAYELQNGNNTVLSVGLKYGYNSPTAFTRAFINMHGITPSGAKKQGVPLKSYPRISFQISIKGDGALVYRIEEKEKIRLVGIKETVLNDGIYNFQRIPQMWAEANQNGMVQRIFELSNGNPCGMMGAITYSNDTIDYYIAVSSDENLPDGMNELIVEKSTWAIFPCIGRHTIQPAWKRIYGEWFPSSGFEHTGGAEIEWYSEEDPSAEDYLTEIWIPIKKQKG